VDAIYFAPANEAKKELMIQLFFIAGAL